MGDSLVKVTDAATGELKRWETPNGKPIAAKENGNLVLTRLGKQLGFRVFSNCVRKVR
ncbi:hypothetical protein [Candidatus Hecatella orcuttiae]|jgi:hypothetical protein|uniref:hypothetical protein n=1 Tax=Candidatus Hecatella orcuttiae TaxID=1935119 RepID=UPI002867D76B|nr:hypothetical protein [Candidatus Hecatella orcuttiae]